MPITIQEPEEEEVRQEAPKAIKLHVPKGQLKMKHLVELESCEGSEEVMDWLVKYAGADKDQLMELDPDDFTDVADQVNKQIFRQRKIPNSRRKRY